MEISRDVSQESKLGQLAMMVIADQVGEKNDKYADIPVTVSQKGPDSPVKFSLYDTDRMAIVDSQSRHYNTARRLLTDGM